MYLGSWVAHGISSAPAMRPHILPLAILVSGLAVAVNYILVGTAMSIEHGYSIRRVLGKLRLGTLQDYVLVLLAAPVLSAMLASLYDQTRAWALLAFLAPI